MKNNHGHPIHVTRLKDFFNQACEMQHTLTCSWKRTVATAKGMQDADIPTSAIAKLTNKRCNWFRMERFQNTTRHTEMFPRIPTSVVIPSNIPIMRIMPDNGMIHTADAREVVWSLEPDKQSELFSTVLNWIVFESQ